MVGKTAVGTLNMADKASVGLAKMAADVTGAAFDASLATLNDAGEIVAYAGKPVSGGLKMTGSMAIGSLNMADKTSVALAKMAADVTGAAFDASLATLNDAGEIVSYAGKPVSKLGYSGLKLAASTPMNVLNAADKGSEQLAGFSANILGAGFDATLTTLNEAGEVVAYAGQNRGKPREGAWILCPTNRIPTPGQHPLRWHLSRRS